MTGLTAANSAGVDDPQNATYVEVGLFWHRQTGDDYLMVVNRRTLPGQTRWVTVQTNLSGQWCLTDVLNNESFLTSDGTLRRIRIAPGAGRLFRVRQLFTADETWSDTVNVVSTVTVPPGRSLTLAPGTTLRFHGSSRLEVSGRLNAVGNATSHITFTRSGTSGTWGGIRFYDSADDASRVAYCDISHGFFGVYCNRANPTIDHNNISNCSYGIATYYAAPEIHDNVLTDNVYCGVALKYADLSGQGTELVYNNDVSGTSYGHGIFLQRSSPHLYGNVIHDNESAGLYCYSQGNAQLRHHEDAFNEIYDNVDYGLWANYSDNVYMGSYQDWLVLGTYNSTWGPDSHVRVRVDHGSTVTAEKNWWGSDLVQSDWFQALDGSSIDYQPWLLQEELEGGSLAATGPPAYLSARSRAEKVDAAAWYYWHDELERALALSEEVLDPGEDDRLSRRAVVIAWSVMKDRAPRAFVDWAENLHQEHPGKTFAGLARLLEGAVHVALGDARTGVKLLRSVAEEFTGTGLHQQALVDLAHFYALDLDEPEAARGAVHELQELFGDDPPVDIAWDALRWSSDGALRKSPFPAESPEAPVPLSFRLDQNRPNPFNPVTTISYTLERPGRVWVVVYNARGEVVRTLVDELQQAGQHRVVFDASELPSGIYFCRLSASGFSAVRKMLLVR